MGIALLLFFLLFNNLSWTTNMGPFGRPKIVSYVH
jgi:hypothetical protein